MAFSWFCWANNLKEVGTLTIQFVIEYKIETGVKKVFILINTLKSRVLIYLQPYEYTI